MGMGLSSKALKQIVAGTVAGVFFFTTVSEPYAQTSFWSERQAARQAFTNPSADARPLLASIQWPKESLNPILGAYRLPASFGSIVETHSAGPNAPVLIHIQDAHGVYGAQYNSSLILDGLFKSGWSASGALPVYQEGGAGPANIDWLSSFPFDDIRERVARAHLRKGDLTGEEYRALASSSGVYRLVGAETDELYRENLAARHETAKARAAADAHIAGLQQRLMFLKKRIYPSSLLALDEPQKAYEEQRISFVEYAQKLQAFSPERLRPADYPNLDALLRLTKLEAALDIRALSEERETLVLKLAGRLSEATVKDLMVQAVAVREGRMTQRAFYQTLLSAADQLKRNGEELPTKELRRYVGYLTLSESLRHDALLNEAEQFHSRLAERFAANDRVWRLMTTDRRVALERLLWKHEMTPDQYAAFKQEGPLDWPEVERYIAAQESALTVPSPQEGEGGPKGRVRGIPDLSWTASLPQVRAYYELALERDLALVQNALADMERTGAKRAVLIAGGFHTPGLARTLRQAGAAYAVLQPSFDAEGPSRNEMLISRDLKELTHSVREMLRLKGQSGGEDLSRAIVAENVAAAAIGALSLKSEERLPYLARLRAWMDATASHQSIKFHAAFEIGETAADRLIILYGTDHGKNFVFVYREERNGEPARFSRIEAQELEGKNAIDLSSRLRGIVESPSIMRWMKQALGGMKRSVSSQWLMATQEGLVQAGIAGRLAMTTLETMAQKPILPQAREGEKLVKAAKIAAETSLPRIQNKLRSWASQSALFLRQSAGRVSLFAGFVSVGALGAFLMGGSPIGFLASTGLALALFPLARALTRTIPSWAPVFQWGPLAGIAAWVGFSSGLLPAVVVVSLAFGMIPLRRLFLAGLRAVPATARTALLALAVTAGFVSPVSAAQFSDSLVTIEPNDQFFRIAKEDLVENAGVETPSRAQIHARFQEYVEANPGKNLNNIHPGETYQRPALSNWTGEPTGAATVQAAPPAPVTAEVATPRGGNLNLRTEPDGNWAASLPNGTSLTVIDRQGSWVKVEMEDGRTGWVAERFVNIQAPAAPVASIEPAPAPAPTTPTVPEAPPAPVEQPATQPVAPPSAAPHAPPAPIEPIAAPAAAIEPAPALLSPTMVPPTDSPVETAEPIAPSPANPNLAPPLPDTIPWTINNTVTLVFAVLLTVVVGLWALLRLKNELSRREGASLFTYIQTFLNEGPRTFPKRWWTPLMKLLMVLAPVLPPGRARSYQQLVQDVIGWRTIKLPAYASYAKHGGMAASLALKNIKRAAVRSERSDDRLKTLRKNKKTLLAEQKALAKQAKHLRGYTPEYLERCRQVSAELDLVQDQIRAQRITHHQGRVQDLIDSLVAARPPTLTPDEARMHEVTINKLRFYLDKPLPEGFMSSNFAIFYFLAGPVIQYAFATAFLLAALSFFNVWLHVIVLAILLPHTAYAFGPPVELLLKLILMPFIKSDGHRRRDFLDVVREHRETNKRPFTQLVSVPKFSTSEGDANAWFMFRRQEIENLRPTLEAAGDDYRVNYLMVNNTPLPKFRHMEMAKLADLENEIEPWAGDRVGFLYLTQAMEWESMDYRRSGALDDMPVDHLLEAWGKRVVVKVGDEETERVYRFAKVEGKGVYEKIIGGVVVETMSPKKANAEVSRLVQSGALASNMFDKWGKYVHVVGERNDLVFEESGGKIIFTDRNAGTAKVISEWEANQILDGLRANINIRLYRRGAWMAKMGNVYSGELLKMGYLRPVSYTDPASTRVVLNPDAPFFPFTEFMAGSLIRFFGGDVMVAFQDGKRRRGVRFEDVGGGRVRITMGYLGVGNTWIGKPDLVERWRIEEAENWLRKYVADPSVEPRLIKYGKQPGPTDILADVDLSFIEDDKNVLVAGALEALAGIAAHEDNAGVIGFNPTIDVAPAMADKQPVPSEAVSSVFQQMLLGARYVHNAFGAKFLGELFGLNSPMFGKLGTRGEYGQTFYYGGLTPGAILSHDWQESILSYTEAAYGAGNLRLSVLSVQETSDGMKTISVLLRRGEDLIPLQITMAKDGGRVVVGLFVPGEGGVFRHSRDFRFDAGITNEEVLRRLLPYVTNEVRVTERDMLTVEGNLARDVRWLRGDWQMLLTEEPYSWQGLLMAHAYHLRGIFRRHFGDYAFLVQLMGLGVLYFFPHLVAITSPILAGGLLAVALFGIIMPTQFIFPFLFFLKERRGIEDTTSWVATRAIKRTALFFNAFIFSVFSGIIMTVYSTLISLPAILKRSGHSLRLLRDDLSGQDSSWEGSSNVASKELAGISWKDSWEHQSEYKIVKRGFLVLSVFIITVGTGNVAMAALGLTGYIILIASFLVGWYLAWLGGQPFKVNWDDRWNRRKKKFYTWVSTLAMASVVFMPTLRSWWVESLMKDLRTPAPVEELLADLGDQELRLGRPDLMVLYGGLPPTREIENAFSPFVPQIVDPSAGFRAALAPRSPRTPLKVEIGPIPTGDPLPEDVKVVPLSTLSLPPLIPTESLLPPQLTPAQKAEVIRYLEQAERLGGTDKKLIETGAGIAMIALMIKVPVAPLVFRVIDIGLYAKGAVTGELQRWPWLAEPVVNRWFNHQTMYGFPPAALADLLEWDKTATFWNTDWSPWVRSATDRDLIGRMSDNQEKLRYLNTAVLTLKNAGVADIDITEDMLWQFMSAWAEAEEMLRSQAPAVDVLPTQFPPKEVNRLLRWLGNIQFFSPPGMEIPIGQAHPELLTMVGAFVGRPGGVAESMALTAVLNDVHIQTVMSLAGLPYINNYYKSPRVNQPLWELSRERALRSTKELHPKATNEAVEKMVEPTLAFSVLSAEYALGRAAVLNREGREPRGFEEIRQAALETSRNIREVQDLARSAAPRVYEALMRYVPGVLEVEGIQLYAIQDAKTRADYLKNMTAVLEEAERLWRDGARPTEDFLNGYVLSLVSEDVRRAATPESKTFMGLREMASLSLLARKNGMRRSPEALAQKMVEAKRRLDRYGNLPTHLPGVVAAEAMLGAKAHSLHKDWGDKRFWAQREPVLKWLAERYSPREEAWRKALRSDPRWKKTEDFLVKRLGVTSEDPEARFYSALSAIAPLAINAAQGYPAQAASLKGARLWEIIRVLGERSQVYDAKIAALRASNKEFPGSEGFVAYFVLAGLGENGLDGNFDAKGARWEKEMAEFRLDVINDLWKRGVYKKIPDVVKDLVAGRFQAIRKAEKRLGAVSPSEIQFQVLGLFHQLAESVIYNSRDMDAPPAYDAGLFARVGLDVVRNLTEVLTQAEGMKRVPRYLREVPGFVENEAVFITIQTEQALLRAETPEDKEKAAVDNEKARSDYMGYLNRVFKRMDRDVWPALEKAPAELKKVYGNFREARQRLVPEIHRPRQTEEAKEFAAVRALAVMMETWEVNRALLQKHIPRELPPIALEEWLNRAMDVLDHMDHPGKFNQSFKMLDRIPFAAPGSGLWDMYTILNTIWVRVPEWVGPVDFWDHFYPRFAIAQDWLSDPAVVAEHLVDPKTGPTKFVRAVDDMLRLQTGVSYAREERIMAFNSAMALADMVLIFKLKTGEDLRQLGVGALVELYLMYVDTLRVPPGMPQAYLNINKLGYEPGFVESLVLSGLLRYMRGLQSQEEKAAVFNELLQRQKLREVDILIGIGLPNYKANFRGRFTRAELKRIIESEAPFQLRVQENVIDFLILQKLVAVGQTYNLLSSVPEDPDLPTTLSPAGSDELTNKDLPLLQNIATGLVELQHLAMDYDRIAAGDVDVKRLTAFLSAGRPVDALVRAELAGLRGVDPDKPDEPALAAALNKVLERKDFPAAVGADPEADPLELMRGFYGAAIHKDPRPFPALRELFKIRGEADKMVVRAKGLGLLDFTPGEDGRVPWDDFVDLYLVPLEANFEGKKATYAKWERDRMANELNRVINRQIGGLEASLGEQNGPASLREEDINEDALRAELAQNRSVDQTVLSAMGWKGGDPGPFLARADRAALVAGMNAFYRDIRETALGEEQKGASPLNAVREYYPGGLEPTAKVSFTVLARANVKVDQLIADAAFMDVHRLKTMFDRAGARALMARHGVSPADLLAATYRNIRLLKGLDPQSPNAYFSEALRSATTYPLGEKLGELQGQIENTAYVFALVEMMAFGPKADPALKDELARQGIKDIRALMERYYENVAFLKTVPEFQAAMGELANKNPTAEVGAMVGWAFLLTFNPTMKDHFAEVAARFPGLVVDMKDFLGGVRLRADSPVLAYEAIRRSMSWDLGRAGDYLERRAVKENLKNRKWMAQMIVKESYRLLFGIYLNEEQSPEDAKELEYWTERVTKDPQAALSSLLESILNQDSVMGKPNPYRQLIRELTETVNKIEALKHVRGSRLSKSKLELEKDVYAKLLASAREVESYLRETSQKLDAAYSRDQESHASLLWELLLGFALLGSLVGVGAYVRRRRPALPVGMMTLAAIAAAGYNLQNAPPDLESSYLVSDMQRLAAPRPAPGEVFEARRSTEGELLLSSEGGQVWRAPSFEKIHSVERGVEKVETKAVPNDVYRVNVDGARYPDGSPVYSTVVSFKATEGGALRILPSMAEGIPEWGGTIYLAPGYELASPVPGGRSIWVRNTEVRSHRWESAPGGVRLILELSSPDDVMTSSVEVLIAVEKGRTRLTVSQSLKTNLPVTSIQPWSFNSNYVNPALYDTNFARFLDRDGKPLMDENGRPVQSIDFEEPGMAFARPAFDREAGERLSRLMENGGYFQLANVVNGSNRGTPTFTFSLPAAREDGLRLTPNLFPVRAVDPTSDNISGFAVLGGPEGSTEGIPPGERTLNYTIDVTSPLERKDVRPADPAETSARPAAPRAPTTLVLPEGSGMTAADLSRALNAMGTPAMANEPAPGRGERVTVIPGAAAFLALLSASGMASAGTGASGAALSLATFAWWLVPLLLPLLWMSRRSLRKARVFRQFEPTVRMYSGRLAVAVDPQSFNPNGGGKMRVDRPHNLVAQGQGTIEIFNALSNPRPPMAALVDGWKARHEGSTALAALPAGNVEFNHQRHVAVADGRVYFPADEDLSERPYVMLVSWIGGGTSAENISFRKQGETWRAYQNNVDVTDRIDSALAGLLIVKDGRSNVSNLAEDAEDLRHFLRLPMFNYGKRQIHPGYSDDVGQLLKDRDLLARAIKGETVALDLRPLKKFGISMADILKSFAEWGYEKVAKAENVRKAGQFFLDDLGIAYIRFLPGVHPQEAVGLTKDGQMMVGAAGGTTHFEGTTLEAMAQAFIREGALTVWNFANGKDVLWKEGEETIVEANGARSNNSMVVMVVGSADGSQTAASARISWVRKVLKRFSEFGGSAVKIAAYLFEKTVKVVLIGIVLAGVGAAIASGAGALGTGAAAAGEALPTLFAMALVLAMPTRAGEAGAWALSDALRAWFEKGAGLGWPVHLPGQGQALMTDLRVGTVVNAAGDVQVDPAVGAAFLRQMRSLAARLEDDQTPIVVDLVFSDAQFKALDLDEARWAVAFRERLAEAGIPAHVAKRIKFGLVGESRVNARLAELADMEISVIAPPSAVEFWKGFGVPVAILAVVLQGLANVETEVIFTGAAADAVEKLTGLQPKNGEIRLEKMSTPLESIAEEGRKLLLFNKNA